MLEKRNIPCTPSIGEKEHLVDLVKEARAAREFAENLKKLEEKLRIAAQMVDSSASDLEAWKRVYDQLLHRQKDSEDAFRKAVSETIVTYGLSTMYYPGEIQSGPYKGTGVIPLPRFQETVPTYFKSQGTDGKDHFDSYLPDFTRPISGRTLQDGTILVTDRVLKQVVEQGHPRLLASVLHHEAVHLHDLTTGPGWDTREDEEVRAYDSDLATADIFELRPQEKRDLYAYRETYHRVPPEQKRPLHPNDTEDPKEVAGWDDQQRALDEIREQQASLGKQVALEHHIRAWKIVETWAAAACASGDWHENFSWDHLYDPYKELFAEPPYDDYSLHPFDQLGAISCENYITNQVAVRRSHDATPPSYEWMQDLSVIGWNVGQAHRLRQADLLTERWATEACQDGSWPTDISFDALQGAYQDLRVYQGAIFNYWDMPAGYNIPCPLFVVNWLDRMRQGPEPLPGWDALLRMVKTARAKSVASPTAPVITLPPAPAPTPATTPGPQPPPPSDPGTGRSDPQPPPTPHCRFHPWCRDNLWKPPNP